MDLPDDVLAAVVDDLPTGVFALDTAGRVLLWNTAAERLTGWSRERVLGRIGPDDELADSPPARRAFDEVRAGRPFVGRLPAPSGSEVTLYFRAVPGTRPDGPAVVAVLQDVEDTVAGDEAFALLDALWETAPVGLAYFDSELRYRRVNGAVLDADGGTVDQRLGRTLSEVHGETGEVIAAGLRQVLTDGVARLAVPVQGRLWHGSGPPQEWRLSYYPVRARDGAVLGVGVVLLDVTVAERTRRELAQAAAQREHALTRYQSLVEATSAAVWIRDARGDAADDAPGLRAITGQDVASYRGRGFLAAVHPGDRERVATAWTGAVEAGRPEVFTISYRLATAAGRHRWFRTRAVPVRSGGAVVEWVGTETDIDDEVRARRRLDLLARATVAVNAALDPVAELTALAEVAVPEFADVCRVYLLEPPPAGSEAGPLVGRRSVTRTAPELAPSPSSQERFVFGPAHPITRSVRSRAPLLVGIPVPETEQWPATVEQRRWGADIGANSMLVAPVLSRGTPVAALLFVACAGRSPYAADDLALVGELAARASTAVQHAREFQQSRQVALALQSAMLTEPPKHPGLQVQARYVAAGSELEVGGDWYDAFALPGGDLAVGVGDVVGHDLPAAAAMGQLRSMLRALAHDSVAEPAEVLRRLDTVARALDVTRFTTLIYGRVTHHGGGARFRWSNAGHPVPLVVGVDGVARAVPGEVGTVLGMAGGSARPGCEIDLRPGETLLLHTDGLVERRHDPDDRAGADLLALVESGAALALPEFCDHLVRATPADTGDDMVVLAVRVLP